MYICRVLDFLVVMVRLLIYGVGFFIWVNIFNFIYLFNFFLSCVLRVVGIFCGRIIIGFVLLLVLRCIVFGSDFIFCLKIFVYFWIIFLVEVNWWIFGWDGLVGEVVMKFELFILINFICWVVCVLISGVNVLWMMMNLIEYFLWFFRLCMIICVELIGVMFVLFYMCSDCFDGLIV